MKTNFELIKEFHAVFGRTPDPTVPSIVKNDTKLLRANLIFEEAEEVFAELGLQLDFQGANGGFYETEHNISLPKLAKELADLLYVVYGTAATYGIPIDDVYRKVHENNMSKLQPDGTVKRREDGKVLKPDTYKPLDIDKILE